MARLEDLEDLAAIAERLAYEEKVGKEVARRDYLSGEEMRRILDDESPVKVLAIPMENLVSRPYWHAKHSS